MENEPVLLSIEDVGQDLSALTVPFEESPLVDVHDQDVVTVDHFRDAADVDGVRSRVGMDQLARILRGKHADDLDPLCDTITTALLPPNAADQRRRCLPYRPHPPAAPTEDIATWPLPDDPTAAREARRHVRDQLAAWALGDELQMATELIISELVGNVIRHATGPIHMRLLRSDSLICEVTDGSLSTPHIRHPSFTDEGGRGLQLVAAMAQRWGARHRGL